MPTSSRSEGKRKTAACRVTAFCAVWSDCRHRETIGQRRAKVRPRRRPPASVTASKTVSGGTSERNALFSFWHLADIAAQSCAGAATLWMGERARDLQRLPAHSLEQLRPVKILCAVSDSAAPTRARAGHPSARQALQDGHLWQCAFFADITGPTC